MATVIYYPKRLRLSKDNVYVDLLEAVPPNVLKGVRFLYKQFVQKPGVIINDPPGCEQETQVAMFLRAIHKGLEQQLKPVLILCHSSKLTIWMDTLLKWIPNYDEVVAIDWAKPSIKKSIYVVTADRLQNYCRRDWGIAVIDDDAFLQYKLPPNTFSVMFKIFITTDDLRDHLMKLKLIHKWLYPDLDLDVEQFRPKKQLISDFLEKRIWFSAFAEDLIVRCDKQDPLKCPEPVEPTPRVTKKNKDATGTKIKRSKRKIEDDNTESANKKVVTNNIPEKTNSSVTCTSKVSDNYDSEDNMDIERFIREREPIKMDELNYIPDIDSIPLVSEKNDVVEEKSEELEEKTEDLEENSDDMKLNYSEDLDTDDAAYALETQDDGLGNNELESKETLVSNIIGNDNDITNVIEEKPLTAINVEDTPVENTMNNDTKEMVEEKSEVNNLAGTRDVENKKIISKDTNNGEENETKLESKDEVNPIKENVKKEGTKSNDLDSKWEENALKKFKGSLLDRIF